MADTDSYTQIVQASEAVKPGLFVMINNRPCKVVDVSKSKPGKHGSAKLNYTGIDIFTANKLLGTCPTSTMLKVPIVKRIEFTLLNISEDDYLSLLMDGGKTKDDVKLDNNDMCQQIRKHFESGADICITLLDACGEECIVSYKVE